MKNQSGLQYARRFFYTQMIVALILTLFFSHQGTQSALSAVCGGLVSVLPNMFFARKLFAEQRAVAAKIIIMQFYQGEALKIVISTFMFAIAFLWIHVIPWVFFTTYIVVQMMSWFAPLIVRRTM